MSHLICVSLEEREKEQATNLRLAQTPTPFMRERCGLDIDDVAY